ncbi:unnamed protein product [Symbiodinium natans]|uniref:Uncharacterized protein n=1 Tax=Symbiodinium natans TaxID=878477 RepID=A0A812G947_9DINO|nr:unnamed protein product [Symbiodinium natans]
MKTFNAPSTALQQEAPPRQVLEINETDSSISSLAFTDKELPNVPPKCLVLCANVAAFLKSNDAPLECPKDLDPDELGGNVTWTEPVDARQQYFLYLGSSLEGSDRVPQSLPVGTEMATIPAETQRNLATHLLVAWSCLILCSLLCHSTSSDLGRGFRVKVYTASSLAEQTTPVALQLVDTVQAASTCQSTAPSGIEFLCRRLGAGELRGEESLGSLRSAPSAQIAANVSLYDLDLDLKEAGGEISWALPEDGSTVVPVWSHGKLSMLHIEPLPEDPAGLVEHFDVYIAKLPEGDLGCNSSEEVLNGTDSDSTLSCEVLGFSCCFRETNLSLPAETALVDFTHILVYARSQLAEQSTPALHLINDESDLDFDADELGGDITWRPPSSDRVQDYLVYLSDGQSRSQVESAIPAGTNVLTVPDNTQGIGYSSFLVFTRSTLAAEQTTPVALSFSDSVVSLGNLSFTDLDLDATDLGGTLAWEEPSDSAYVTHYEARDGYPTSDYHRSLVLEGATLAEVSAAVRASLLVALGLSAQELMITDVTEGTYRRLGKISQHQRRLATAWTAFWKASRTLQAATDLGQDLPRFQAILSNALTAAGVDDSSLVLQSFSAVTMEVQALSDDSQVEEPETSDSNATDAGNASDDSDVRRLQGENSDAQNESNETSTTTMTSTVTTTATSTVTTSSTRTRFCLKAPKDHDNHFRNHDVNDDYQCNVRGWTRCGNGFYMTYLGTSMMGQPYFQVEPDLPLATWSHFLVFAASDFGEASTPTTHLIYDMSASVSDVAYDGLDLDLDQLGGNVTWSPPNLTESAGNASARCSPLLLSDLLHSIFCFCESLVPMMTHAYSAQVRGYMVYLAESSFGLSRAWIPPEVPVGSNFLLIPPDTERENYSHIVVYTKSELIEQTTPAFLAFADTAESAANASFVDEDPGMCGGMSCSLQLQSRANGEAGRKDLDLGQIGGKLVWDPPADLSSLPEICRITDFLIYVALDAMGTNRSLVGSASAGISEISVPLDTDIPSNSYLVVYVTFVDYDLDNGEIGGNVSWTPPNSTDYVEVYKAYLAADDVGTGKSQIGDDLPIDVSEETPLSDFTHVTVYTKSALGEQTTPVSAALSDTSFFVVQEIDDIWVLLLESFVDLDLDLADVGGVLAWAEALDDAQVAYYNIYLGTDCIENVTLLVEKQVAPAQKTNMGDCQVISGIVSISLDGATSQQARLVFRAEVAGQQLPDPLLRLRCELLWPRPLPQLGLVEMGVPASALYVTGGTGRRLATLWEVSYVIVVPNDQALDLSSSPPFCSILGGYSNGRGVQQCFLQVVVNFATVSVQLITADKLPSVLPSSPTFAFNVTESEENETDVTRTTTTTPEDTWLLKMTRRIRMSHASIQKVDGTSPRRQCNFNQDTDNDQNCDADGNHLLDLNSFPDLNNNDHYRGSGEAIGVVWFFFSWVNETLLGEDADAPDAPEMHQADAVSIEVPVRRLSSIASNVTEALSGASDSPALVAPQNFTRTRLIFCAQRFDHSGFLIASVIEELPLAVPEAETQLGNATHLLIYAASAYAESSIASGGIRVEDVEASAVNVSFVDQELRRDVESFSFYLTDVEPARGASRFLLGKAVKLCVSGSGIPNSSTVLELPGVAGSEIAELPATTSKRAWEGFKVYTKSALVEQTTPTSISLSAVDFPDFDLDFIQIGGVLSWDEPADISQVIRYDIYWASGLSGLTNSSGFVCTAESDGTIMVNASNGEDSDGGFGPFLPCRGSLYAEVATGVQNLTVPPDTDRGNYTHFLIYTRSRRFAAINCADPLGFTEQSNPAALAIFDANASVSNLEFAKTWTFTIWVVLLGTLGPSPNRLIHKELMWDPPEDISRVEAYAAYLAMDASGENRSQIGPDIPVGVWAAKSGNTGRGSNSLSIFPETPRLLLDGRQSKIAPESFTVVYTKSILVEQTTPSDLLIQDAAARSSNVSFTDQDLDVGEDVLDYLIYMAEDRVGNVSVGEDAFLDNTPLRGFTHFLVYSRSALVEQTTPAAIVILDVSAVVTNLAFQDLDLDVGELGGTIQWSPPQALQGLFGIISGKGEGEGAGFEAVISYGIYLAEDAVGLGRREVATAAREDVEAQVADNTAAGSVRTLSYGCRPSELGVKGRFEFILAYTRSVFEQSTPTWAPISDVFAQAGAIQFEDLDLDETQLGGTLSWQPPSDSKHVDQYVAYLAYFCNGTNSSEMDLGEESPVYVAGVFSFPMEAATPEQVTAAARAALAEALGVANSAISGLAEFAKFEGVTVNLARRLSSLVAGSSATEYVVHYELPVEDAPTMLQSASAAEEEDGMDRVSCGFAGTLAKEQISMKFAGEEDVYENMRSWMKSEAGSVYCNESDNESSDDSDLETQEPGCGQGKSWDNLVSEDSRGYSFANLTGDNLAVRISGSLRFSLDGATASQASRLKELQGRDLRIAKGNCKGEAVYSVETAVRAALASSFGVGPAAFSCSGFDTFYCADVMHVMCHGCWRDLDHGVQVSQARRLTTHWIPSLARMLSSTYQVTYQLTVPVEEADVAWLQQDLASVEFWAVVDAATAIASSFAARLNKGLSAAGRRSSWLFDGLLCHGRSDTRIVTLAPGLWMDDLNEHNIRSGDPRDEIFLALHSHAQSLWGRTAGTVFAFGNQLAFAPNTHFLVYTVSNFSEQSHSGLNLYSGYPSALAIVDVAASASGPQRWAPRRSNVAFLDLDLDPDELGGLVRWTPAVAPAVQDYLVYLDTSSSFSRSQLGAATPAETARQSYDLIAVYTRPHGNFWKSGQSTLAEQTTPVAIRVEASAENVSFVDLDLDEFDLGGVITWLPAGNVELVESYATWPGDEVVYFAESICDFTQEPPAIEPATTPDDPCPVPALQDANETYTSENATLPTLCNLLHIETVDAQNATNMSNFSIFLSPETLLRNYTHLAVFTKSVLVEQTTPAAHLIFDAAASVSDLTFDDLDLDEQQLGGRITFAPPLSSQERVESYGLYLSPGAETSRKRGGMRALSSSSCQALPPETDIPSFEYIVAYTRSSLVEQSTPVAIRISDVQARVENVSFFDQDLDFTDTRPEVPKQAEQGRLHASRVKLHRDLHQRVVVGGAGTFYSRSSDGKASFEVVPETSRLDDNNSAVQLAYNSFLIYAKSALVEQTTPEIHQIFDAKANVVNPLLVDEDLDLDEIGAASPHTRNCQGRVLLYRAVLAMDSAATGRSQIGEDIYAPGLETNLSAEQPLVARREWFPHLSSLSPDRHMFQNASMHRRVEPKTDYKYDSSLMPKPEAPKPTSPIP